VQCLHCKHAVPPHMRECPVCGEPAGFPNVRACESLEELNALDARYKQAMKHARTQSKRPILRRFEQELSRSKAVICRSLSIIQRLMSSDTELYNNFYNMVDSNARIPEENRWDNTREAVDGMIFPHYHHDICFAALSLNDKGPKSYGDYCMVLKTDLIKRRATTFEENTYVFAEKHRLVVTEPVPVGYRASWEDRGRLGGSPK
jgi:predicted nucleic acid-binding Zn ribbon protein